MEIISGGQTGVDQAALQAAIDAGLDHGGWCPPGRVCESGVIPAHFQLKETPRERSPEAMEIPRSQRTIWNVRDASATLVLSPTDQIDLGTQFTIETAIQLNKSLFIVNPLKKDVTAQVLNWLIQRKPEVLNVAGPSEQQWPGIGTITYNLLLKVLKG